MKFGHLNPPPNAGAAPPAAGLEAQGAFGEQDI